MNNITIIKVALEEMVPEVLAKVSDDILKLYKERLRTWYDAEAREAFIKACSYVLKEMKVRGMEVDTSHEVEQKALSLPKPIDNFQNMPTEMVVVKDFVNIVGSSAIESEQPNDIDILIRADLDNMSNALIRSENIWVPIRNALGAKLNDLQIDYIFNPQGPHATYVPMYDLVLRKRNVQETIVIKGEFVRGDEFELVTREGSSTGIVLDSYDDKVVVEFDEPCTFTISELEPFLYKTEKGWKVDKDITISDVHVPTTMDNYKLVKTEELCAFCDMQAKKILISGGNTRRLYTCEEHLDEAIKQVMDIDRDAINNIVDLEPAENENNIEIKIEIKKEEEETLPTDNWFFDSIPESGCGEFIYHRHWSGLSGTEKDFTAEQLIKTDHSTGEHLRFEGTGSLWSFAVANCEGGDRYLSAPPQNALLKAESKDWLKVGTKKPLLAGPGGAQEKYAKFFAIDKGTYEVGVVHRDFVEIFMKGEHFKGHYVLSMHSDSITGKPVWKMRKTSGHTPIVEQITLKEYIKNKGLGNQCLIWAKPGEKPLYVTPEKTFDIKINKAEVEKQLVTGVVMEPDSIDAHGDVVSAEEIEQASHDFMVNSRVAGLQHRGVAKATVVESFIAQSDMTIGDQFVKAGSWIMTMKVLDKELWESIKKGEFTGFSIGGYALRSAL